jgi:hypothetical protein
VLEFVTRPIRAVLGLTEHDVVESLHEARDIEANMLDAVHAIENATASIERHVEVIETLATSVDPLRASVDRLTDTMQELVAMLAPMGAAEHEMQRVATVVQLRSAPKRQPRLCILRNAHVALPWVMAPKSLRSPHPTSVRFVPPRPAFVPVAFGTHRSSYPSMPAPGRWRVAGAIYVDFPILRETSAVAMRARAVSMGVCGRSSSCCGHPIQQSVVS